MTAIMETKMAIMTVKKDVIITQNADFNIAAVVMIFGITIT